MKEIQKSKAIKIRIAVTEYEDTVTEYEGYEDTVTEYEGALTEYEGRKGMCEIKI